MRLSAAAKELTPLETCRMVGSVQSVSKVELLRNQRKRFCGFLETVTAWSAEIRSWETSLLM
jgi:hypothetical protein